MSMFEFGLKEAVEAMETYMIAYDPNQGVVRVVHGDLDSKPSVGQIFPRGTLRPDGEWRVTLVFDEMGQRSIAELVCDLGYDWLMEVLQRSCSIISRSSSNSLVQGGPR